MIKMKDSGIPWIGQIPEDWEVAKYKFFATSGMGETILGGNLVEDGIPVYSATQNNTVFGYVKSSSLKLNKNDFVIPARGNSIGCVTIVKDNEATATQTTIYSKLNDKINYKFLYYCCVGLKDVWFYFEDTAIPQITVNQVQNNKVPLPPKEIQQKIVEILDKKCGQIDELVRIEENEIEKLKEYKTSLITKVVTKGLDPNAKMKDSGIPWIGQIPESWIVAKIKNVVEICNGKEVEDNDGEVLVYGSGGIFGKTSKIMYDNESVLLGRKGTVDRPIYLKDIKFWCVDTMFYTKSKNLILMKLFYYIMFIFDYKPYIYGTALPSMSQSILNEIYIPLAKNVVQQQIVEYLDKMCEEIDNLIKIKQEKIEKLKEYKKSLIYQYVTGKKEVI